MDYRLEIMQMEHAGLQRKKFNLLYHKYYIRFWKNKKRLQDIAEVDKEIEALKKKYNELQAEIHKEDYERYRVKMDYSGWFTPESV